MSEYWIWNMEYEWILNIEYGNIEYEWMWIISTDCCWLLLIVTDCYWLWVCWLWVCMMYEWVWCMSEYCWLWLIVTDCCWLSMITLILSDYDYYNWCPYHPQYSSLIGWIDPTTHAIGLSWMSEFILLAKDAIMPFTASLLAVILPSLSHKLSSAWPRGWRECY